MSASSGKKPRLDALTLLGKVLDDRLSLGEASRFIKPQDDRDRAFATRLAYGSLRWLGALEFLADQMLDKPLRRKDRDVHRLILLGIYQLWKEDTPPHAAISATAECARDRRKKWAVGVINAVLRRFTRERESLEKALAENPERFSHPAWLLEQIKMDWPDNWMEVVNANNRQPPLWIRRHQSRADNKDLIAQLEADGLGADGCPYAPEAMKIDPPRPVQDIPGFSEGLWSVQDAAAQLAGKLLNCQAGDRVLDACAAPGGKTCHILELQPGAEVLALDNEENRLDLVRENLVRLGLEATLVCADATDTEQWWDGQPFDRILLDAPCTATGVIRRHPEIKWLRKPDQVRAAVELQAALLDRLWPLLKSGGILVYATCSVLDIENNQQIQSFLKRAGDASVEIPDGLPGRPTATGVQILPGEEDMDGFFYSLIRKAS